MEVKVSIIVPIYNAALYVERCVSSLLAQTLDNIEILIIDDRGSDNSIEIIKSLVEQHPRREQVNIITMPKNSGAWAARNEGLKCAKGEYVGFVDADDWCELDMCQLLYSAAKESDADWAYGALAKHYSGGKIKTLKREYLSSGKFDLEQKREILTSHVAFFTTGIYRRAHIKKHNIMFPASKFSEDSYFVWMVVATAQRVAGIDKVVYNYLIHSSSVSNKPDKTKASKKVEIFTALRDNLIEQGYYEECKEEIDYLCLKKGFVIPILIELINNKREYRSTVGEILRELDTVIEGYSSNRYLKRDWKLRWMIYMFKHNVSLMALMLRLRYNQDPF